MSRHRTHKPMDVVIVLPTKKCRPKQSNQPRNRKIDVDGGHAIRRKSRVLLNSPQEIADVSVTQ